MFLLGVSVSGPMFLPLGLSLARGSLWVDPRTKTLLSSVVEPAVHMLLVDTMRPFGLLFGLNVEFNCTCYQCLEEGYGLLYLANKLIDDILSEISD